jgi:hypothetical protein
VCPWEDKRIAKESELRKRQDASLSAKALRE